MSAAGDPADRGPGADRGRPPAPNGPRRPPAGRHDRLPRGRRPARPSARAGVARRPPSRPRAHGDRARPPRSVAGGARAGRVPAAGRARPCTLASADPSCRPRRGGSHGWPAVSRCAGTVGGKCSPGEQNPPIAHRRRATTGRRRASDGCASPVRTAVVDPSAYTPAYDHALCAALARAGASVQLVTSRFAYGDVPAPDGYVVRELFYRRARGAPGSRARRLSKLASHVGDMRALRRLAAERRRHRALPVAGDAVARRRAAARRAVGPDRARPAAA